MLKTKEELRPMESLHSFKVAETSDLISSEFQNKCLPSK
jgi:hypothetical protein